MGEQAVSSAVSSAVAAISPVQQMLASGTGALLTSIFGKMIEIVFCHKHLIIISFVNWLMYLFYSHSAGRCEDQAAGSADAVPPR